MIVPMKHLTVIVLESRRTQACKDLEALGMLHVTTLAMNSPGLDALQTEESRIRLALAGLEKSVLGKKAHKGPPPALPELQESGLTGDREDLHALTGRVTDLAGKLDAARAELMRLRSEIRNLEALGDFRVEDIHGLASRGLALVLAGIHRSDLATIPQGAPFFALGKQGAMHWFAADLQDHEPDPRWVLVPWPRQSPGAYRAEADRISALAEKLTAELAALRYCKPLFEERLSALDHLKECARVEAGMLGKGELALVEGFIPASLLPDISHWASEHGWGICWRDPEAGEDVPTEYRSNGFSRMIRPVLDFLGVTPGYHERDISPWFLFFLVIFFSMIIGDAAYGCILLVTGLGLALHARLKGKKVHDLVRLLLVFSGGTIIWGAMNGSWFALEGVRDNPVLGSLMIRGLTDPDTSTQTVLLVCFILGIVHLNLAHLLKFFKDIKSPPHIHSIAQIGWILTLNGAFFLVLNLVIDPVLFPVPSFAWWLVAAGMGTVLVFEKQEGDNFFLGILRSLSNMITTALAGVSAFADIISYVRLFAVGLAGFSIEQSFNAMALPMLGSPSLAMVGGIVILVLGHSLNLVMGGLSVMVHGIRLNMLEFSSHTGLEWSGIPYRPFKARS